MWYLHRIQTHISKDMTRHVVANVAIGRNCSHQSHCKFHDRPDPSPFYPTFTFLHLTTPSLTLLFLFFLRASILVVMLFTSSSVVAFKTTTSTSSKPVWHLRHVFILVSFNARSENTHPHDHSATKRKFPDISSPVTGQMYGETSTWVVLPSQNSGFGCRFSSTVSLSVLMWLGIDTLPMMASIIADLL